MQCLWTDLAVLIELLKLQPAVGGLVCAPAAAAAMPTTKPKGEVIEALKARLVLCLHLDVGSLIYIYMPTLLQDFFNRRMCSNEGSYRAQRPAHYLSIPLDLSCSMQAKSQKLVSGMQVQGAGKDKGHPRG